MITVNYNFEIEQNKKNEKIVKVHVEEKVKYIGSKYDNSRETEKFLNKIKNTKKEKDVFIVYGFATGEHIQALRRKYCNKIIVFEPNRKLMKYINELDWVKEDRRLEVLCCEKTELMKVVKRNIDEYNYKNSEYIYFSNYNLLYKNEFIEFFNVLNEYIVNLALDTNTKLNFNKKWFENIIGIIPYVISGIPSDLYNNTLKNIPAIIVSAGPSLSKNVELLKDNDKVMIFSGGRTLSALLEKKIKPDLLVIADATERNYNLVKNYIKDIDVPLLFSESANLKIVEEHVGLKLFYSYNDLISKIAGKHIDHISTGGSVAHAMTSYAANLGCNPVIFIGQDFAYTDNKTHDINTENKDNSYTFDIAKRDDDIYVEDFYGNKVRTSLVLNNQRMAMEQIIKLYPNIEFINATEGGAKIKGTIQMTLKKALDRYNVSKAKKIEKIEYAVDMKKNAINELRRFTEEINYLLEDLKKTESKEESWAKLIEICKRNQLLEMLLYKKTYEYLSTSYEKNNESLISIINRLEWARNMVLNELIKLKNM